MSFCHLSIFLINKQTLIGCKVQSILSLFCHRFVTLNNFVFFGLWVAVTMQAHFVTLRHHFVTHLSPLKVTNGNGYSSKVTK